MIKMKLIAIAILMGLLTIGSTVANAVQNDKQVSLCSDRPDDECEEVDFEM